MIRSVALIVGLLALLGCSQPKVGIDVTHRQRTQPWDAETVASLAHLPVQDGGRIKPLSTVAQFWLLSANGNRTLSVHWADGTTERLSPMEWLLDCWFHPEQAKHYRCLRVDNSEALDDIKLTIEGRSRFDRYSYAEIAPASAALFSNAERYQKLDAKARTVVQGQVLDLAQAISLVDRIMAFGEFPRAKLLLHHTEGLQRAYPGEPNRPLSFFVEHSVALAAMVSHVRDNGTEMDPERRSKEQAGLQKLIGDLDRSLHGASLLALFAPAAHQEKTWASVNTLLEEGFTRGQRAAPQHLELMRRLEEIAAAPADATRTRAAAAAAATASQALASARGEYAKVATEVSFYRWDFFYRALLVFGAGFLAAALWWMLPSSRLLALGTHGLAVLGTLLVVVGITYRCIIRGKPPVSTLYETILFITAVGCLVGWIIERVNKQRVAISLVTFLGMLGMFLARRFEELEATDTMPQLVAVLDTNFWLSTHVTTVTMGYSAGLLAALIAHVYVFARLAGASKPFTHSLAKMIYGVLCFGLFFSVFGTILGGIWANDSWGRFWGWDPKENGALLICLSQLAILHGRLAGWLRDQGVALAAIAGGMVVAFSWWHVNQLGVGLHSYGFTNGIVESLYWFYGSQLLMLGLGLIASTREPGPAPVAPTVATTNAVVS